MSLHMLSHLSDDALLRDLTALVRTDRATTAVLLAHLAEVDARRLYLPAGYPSMYLYCVGHFHMSEQTAYKRIGVARVARKFPRIYASVAEGRLNLSSILLLAPHLTAASVDGLLEAAAHQTRAGLEQMLARRFPRPDLPTRLVPLSPEVSLRDRAPLSPGIVECAAAASTINPEPSSRTFEPVRYESHGVVPARLFPLAPERFALVVTIPREMHDLLREVQDLLGQEVAPGDVVAVLGRALRLLREDLRHRKFKATSKPRCTPRPSRSSRHIPAHVKRLVWTRDQGRCTFVSDTGRRCASRRDIEFDHVEPFAQGGRATAGNLRLRCRAHNQYEAEHAFGAGFMREKRAQAVRRRAEAKGARCAPLAPAAPCEGDREASLAARGPIAVQGSAHRPAHLAPPTHAP